jgi:hypothetical protein
MTTIGYDKPLYILSFDHRGSFQTKMFGWKGTLTAEMRTCWSQSRRFLESNETVPEAMNRLRAGRE